MMGWISYGAAVSTVPPPTQRLSRPPVLLWHPKLAPSCATPLTLTQHGLTPHFFLSSTSTPVLPATMHTSTMSMNRPCSTTPSTSRMALAAACPSLMGVWK